MKTLHKYCKDCNKLVNMGEFCSDLTGEEKQKAIDHLIGKHGRKHEGDYILLGMEKVACRICEKVTYQFPESDSAKELMCVTCYIDCEKRGIFA